MNYFDGFVAAVPTANKQVYTDHAETARSTMSREMGALSMVEAWADCVSGGELTSFPMAVQKKEDETVVFSWIEWPDKATRDAAWARMMEAGPEAMERRPSAASG